MKRIVAILLMSIVLCTACAPIEHDKVILMGTEDGGGSGYSVGKQSVMRLSDFYGVTKGSMRDNNLLMLGSPSYSLGSSDTYPLADGSQVVLTYNTTGALSETLYTDFESGKSYDLFSYLISIGVLQGTLESEDKPSAPSTDTKPNGNENKEPADIPVFSSQIYKKANIDGKLSLYLSRNTVLTTIGAPNLFGARQYKKDSYIIDCYNLDDGSVLMLDYGYDRKNLRSAAIRGADGVTSGYLGAWSAQSKPADFVRKTVKLNQITALKKGSSAADIYAMLGEPAWFEGKASNYKDAFLLDDGSTVYLSYTDAHSKLISAQQVTAQGKMMQVALQ